MTNLSDRLVWLLPLVSFLLTLAVMPSGIQWLKRVHFGQNIRDEGPEAHKSKAGTPTMGGIVFIPIALAVGVLGDASAAPYIRSYSFLIAAFTMGGLLIGLLDDYRSVKGGKSLGLKAREKLILQAIISALFLWGLAVLRSPGPEYAGQLAPGGLGSIVRWLGSLLICVWIINAANIADGLDGLAGSQAIVAIVAILLGALAFGGYRLAFLALPIVMAAGVMAFLCFNAPPARVFMGDAGSIALGCFVAGYGLVVAPLWVLALATAMWSVEALSVALQVTYFKLTGGKRIFRMAPLHHHFELAGWPESQVTARFLAASVFLGILVPLAIGGLLRAW